MKKQFWVGICLVLLSTTVYAEIRYVSPVIEITVRTGPGVKHKVIAMVASGEKVRLLEGGQDWSRVKLDSGKEGWVLSRFLTTKVPSVILLKQLEKKHEQLAERYSRLQQVSSDLKKENEKLLADLAATGKKLDDTSNAYTTLKKKSADFFKLESSYNDATSQLSEQTEKAAFLEDRLKQKNIWWFLSGAGVLLLGFIIGFSSRRQRRRSSLLS